MSKSRVLIIDDDQMVTKLLAEHLTNEGFEVAAAHLAEQGFKLATRLPPDLIFLDVMLPDATGFQILGRLREDPATKTVPIIMMSGTARYSNQKEIGKNMGANAYIVKPFNVIEVGQKAKELAGAPRDRPAVPEYSQSLADLAEALQPEPEVENSPEPLPLVVPMEEAPQEPPAAEPAIEPASEFEPIQFMSDIPVAETPMLMNNEPAPLSPDPEPEPPPVRRKPVIASAPDSMTVPAPTALWRKSITPDWFWKLTAGLFLTHMIIDLIAARPFSMREASYVMSGWILLLGFLVAVCGALKITLEAEEALKLLALPAAPIVLRALAVMIGLAPKPSPLTDGTFWMHPLDLFETASLVIMGLSIRRLQGSTTKKSILAAFIIALVWCLASRQYFHPF